MPEAESRLAETGDFRLADLPEQVRRALDLCLERNAREPIVLDLRGISDATDFFLIASGDSDVHVRAISEHIIEGFADGGVRPSGIEGQRTARWVLIDYIDLVIHVFHPMVRGFYQLERLWGDAPVLHVGEPGP